MLSPQLFIPHVGNTLQRAKACAIARLLTPSFHAPPTPPSCFLAAILGKTPAAAMLARSLQVSALAPLTIAARSILPSMTRAMAEVRASRAAAVPTLAGTPGRGLQHSSGHARLLQGVAMPMQAKNSIRELRAGASRRREATARRLAQTSTCALSAPCRWRMRLLRPTRSTACRSGRLDKGRGTRTAVSRGTICQLACTRVVAWASRCSIQLHSPCSGQHHSALASLYTKSQPDHHPTLSPVQPPQSMNLTPDQAARVRRAAHLLHTELRLPRDDMLRLLPAVLRAPHFVQVRGRETAPHPRGRPQCGLICRPALSGHAPRAQAAFPRPSPTNTHTDRPPCAEPSALAQVVGPGERRGGAPGAGRTRPAGSAARGGRGELCSGLRMEARLLAVPVGGWVTCPRLARPATSFPAGRLPASSERYRAPQLAMSEAPLLHRCAARPGGAHAAAGPAARRAAQLRAAAPRRRAPPAQEPADF